MDTQWEYKMLKYKHGWKGFDFAQVEQDINEQGRQGWEVINTIAPSITGQTQEIIVILKRVRD